MQEVSSLSKEKLYELINIIPEESVEKVFKMIKLLIEPTDEEIEKWWADNVDSQEGSNIVITPEDLAAIDIDNLKPWDEIKDNI